MFTYVALASANPSKPYFKFVLFLFPKKFAHIVIYARFMPRVGQYIPTQGFVTQRISRHKSLGHPNSIELADSVYKLKCLSVCLSVHN